MDGQEGRRFRGSHEPVGTEPEEESWYGAGQSSDAAENDFDFMYGSGYVRQDYTDAHFECEDQTTVPPRYYTPPDRASRTRAKARSAKKSSGIRASGLICAVLAAALLGGICGSTLTGMRMSSRLNTLETSVAEAAEASQRAIEKAGTAGITNAVAVTPAQSGMYPADIYDLATRQVVGIRTEITVTNFFGMTSSAAVSGSGFIISEDGYIMTNYHVVEDAYTRGLSVQVMTYDGTQYTASIVGVEAANDIAVLKMDAENLTAAVFGNSDDLRVGDTIYAVGNPLGELEFSMSTGYVSALDRVISTEESESINMFQIDAAVNEGNSGGPVYNSYGQVVGIVTAKYSSSGVEGLGFAIPINDASAIAYDLITKGYVTGKARMGLYPDSRYNSMYSQYYGMPLGVYVNSVDAGGAADRAGIRAGDIITAIGSYVIQDYSELKQALRQFSAFETSEVTVYRSGEELRLAITFDEATPD